MKILFIFSLIFVLFGRSCRSSALTGRTIMAKPTPPLGNTNSDNANAARHVSAAQSNPDQFEEQNEKFRAVPKEFGRIDFEKFSYPYKFSYNGRKINVVLKDGEYEYEEEHGGSRFNLVDVFYVDLTNDKRPEAIVMLWHVSCGASCDGGSALFYVYTLKENKLKPIWQYESGSLAYRCGLKSLTVKDRKISMELFGRYSGRTDESTAYESKFEAKDTTRLTFGFNGRRIVEENKEFLPTGTVSVINYQPEISINE